MKYLFFDIECANCYDRKGKICEFGYVQTDENFSVLAEESIKINPCAPFDKKGFAIKGIKFDKPYSYYTMQPNFKTFYSKIKELLCDEQNIVIGHGTKNDAKYLIDECERYHLPMLNYVFYDTQKLAKVLCQRKSGFKLKELYQDFCGEEQAIQNHQALEDAYMTMEIARFYEKYKKESLRKILSYYAVVQLESFEGRIVDKSTYLFYSNNKNALSASNRRLIERFMTDEMAYNTDKVYVLPKEWEKEHFKELIIILNHLKKKRANFAFTLGKDTTYVSCGGEDSRLHRYEEWCKEQGFECCVRVIDFKSFLQEIELEELSLNVSIEEIDEIIGNMKSNKSWFKAYKKTHTVFYKINDSLQGDEFECSVDMPVIQYQTVVMIEREGQTKKLDYCLYYDYLMDAFFHPHPYRVNRGANSYLPKNSYVKAQKRSAERLPIEIANRLKLSTETQIKSIKIINEHPYITSYKFKGRFSENNLEFEFAKQIFADDDFKGSSSINIKDYKIDGEKAICELYDEKLFAKALSVMAKFKFGYKDSDFVEPKIINKKYNEGDEILLPKEYCLMHRQGLLTEEYLPSLIDVKTSVFKNKIGIPVLIRRVKKNENCI